jgi:hypothetical protein
MSIRLRLLLLLVSFALLAAGGAGISTELWAQSPGAAAAGLPQPSTGFPARLFLLGAGLAAAFCALGAVELVRFRPRDEPRTDYLA